MRSQTKDPDNIHDWGNKQFTLRGPITCLLLLHGAHIYDSVSYCDGDIFTDDNQNKHGLTNRDSYRHVLHDPNARARKNRSSSR